MIKKIKELKIRTKLLLLIILTGTVCLALFHFLWTNRFNAYGILNPIFHIAPLYGDEDSMSKFLEEAPNYNIPKSEKDTIGVEQIQPLLNLVDEYTSIYIYGLDGYYRAGKYATAMDNSKFIQFFDLGYRLTGGEGEQSQQFNLKFKNGYATVLIYQYHSSIFLYPYAYISTASCILLFFGVVMFFVSRKMKQIYALKDAILQMASGDLKSAFPQYNKDEIGILAAELDKLRVTFDDTLQQEQESRQANQDLITAISHDLRTPLTILNGYLEVLKLKKSPDMQEEYLNRCLQKTSDIKDMTDRMFEYALVYEENETPKLEPLNYSFLYDCLMENIDFIRLAGFEYALDTHAQPDDMPNFPTILGDATMIKRIFNNIFSNILKYGDKSSPVRVMISRDTDELKMMFKNKVKIEHADIESNHIGLRSVEKMMSLLGGRILYSEQGEEFGVQVALQLSLDDYQT